MDGRGPALTRPLVSTSRSKSPRRTPWPGSVSLRKVGLWALPLAFLAIFFFLPLARILAFSFDLDALSASNLRVAFDALSFTFYQAVLSTLLTLGLGIPAAALFARYTFPGKTLLRALTAVPFMLPTVVVAAGFSALLGPRGWLNLTVVRLFDLAAPPIVFTGTLGAILVAHVFYNTTIVIRLVGGAWSSLDPRLRQAAASLGADSRQVWWRVIVPLLRPSLLAAVLLVFLFDFTSFGVILLLGGPSFATLEVQIYIQALQMMDLPLAALLSLIQLLCTIGFAILYTRLMSRSRMQTTPRPMQANLRAPSAVRERLFVGLMSLALSVFFVLPLFALPLRSVSRLDADRGERTGFQASLTTDYYTELFVNRRDSVFYVPPVRAAANSLIYASATVALSLAMGFPAASALARPGRLERILDPVLILPLGASAVTLGLGFILAFGRWLASPWMVPLAHTLVALPFVIRTLQPALETFPQRLRHAAASLGASPFRSWQLVDWPILRRPALSAAGFAYTISLGEFGATSLLSRPEYPTIPVAIYRFLAQPGGMNYGQAMAMATMLMVLTTAGILLIERWRLPGSAEF
ncbi:MAG: iron ABC transporter permease [Chloroflexota bacterium]